MCALGQRYYVATYGRFNTSDRYVATGGSPTDPTDPQSWNRYAYVGNDPANFRDPSGTIRDNGIDDTPSPIYAGGIGPCGTGNALFGNWQGCSAVDGGYSPVTHYSPPKVPCDITPDALNSYMSTVKGWDNKGQPVANSNMKLAGNGYEIMVQAAIYKVDPRLIIAVAFVESKLGGLDNAQKADNAFGLTFGGKLINNPGPVMGLDEAASLLGSLIPSHSTVDALYKNGGTGYCQSGCDPVAVTQQLKALGGDPTSLTDPCYRSSDGHFYKN